jgi:hypothetical protein
MSRVSHLRSLFEEKVRQANEEKERSKGQLNSPRGGNRRRDSFNRSNEDLFDRSNSNESNTWSSSQSQEKFSIEETSEADTNEKKQDMTFHVVQEPRSYPYIQREDSHKTLPKFEIVEVTYDDRQSNEASEPQRQGENSPPPADNLHVRMEHIEVPKVPEEHQTVVTDHVPQQSPRDLPSVPEVHIVPEEPSQPSPRQEEQQDNINNMNSITSESHREEQHDEDGQPRSGIWKVEVLPSRSPRNLSTINEEGNTSSAEPSPRNNSQSAQSTPRGDTNNDTPASPEVTPHVTDELTSNVDAHQLVELATDMHVKALGALSIVDDYIATPVTPRAEDETPKQLLKVQHEDLDDMEHLKEEEIDTVKSKLGALELKHITLGALLIAHQGQWEVTNLNGILILAVDYVRKSYVLRLYKRDTFGAVWEHRFHKGFIYQQATPTFHTFETSEHNPLIYGLKLFDEQDAKDLHSKVIYFKNTVVRTKEELEAEKHKSVAPLPHLQTLPTPAQPAPNTNTDANTKSKSKGKKNKRGFFDKLFGKSDSSSAPKDFQLSGPSNFKHASHIGVDDKGEFQITNIPVEWKEIFRQAGIRKQDIKDMETFNFVVNVINDAVETQQAAAIQEERQQLQESNEAIVNNTNATTSPDVDQEPQASVYIEVKKPPPLPPRPAFMKDEHVEEQQLVETKPEVVVVERQVTPRETTEISSEPPNTASPVPPPPPPPPPVISPEAKSPTVKKSILADLPPPPPARATLMTEIQQGTKLRKVDTGDQALPDIKGLNQKQTKSLADTLAQAMATRRFEMQEAAPSSTSNDDDWD